MDSRIIGSVKSAVSPVCGTALLLSGFFVSGFVGLCPPLFVSSSGVSETAFSVTVIALDAEAKTLSPSTVLISISNVISPVFRNARVKF